MFILERLNENVPVKMSYSYGRRALSTLRRDVWKQLMVSDSFEDLKQIAKDNPGQRFRIVECGGETTEL